MAVLTLTIDPGAQPAPQHVLDKHFMRKHGPNAWTEKIRRTVGADARIAGPRAPLQ